MKDYLTIPEASAVLGICPNAVRYHCRTRRIKCAKISGAWFVPIDSIEAAKSRPHQERGRRRNGQSPTPLTVDQIIAQRPALPEPDNRTCQEKRADAALDKLVAKMAEL